MNYFLPSLWLQRHPIQRLLIETQNKSTLVSCLNSYEWHCWNIKRHVKRMHCPLFSNTHVHTHSQNPHWKCVMSKVIQHATAPHNPDSVLKSLDMQLKHVQCLLTQRKHMKSPNYSLNAIFKLNLLKNVHTSKMLHQYLIHSTFYTHNCVASTSTPAQERCHATEWALPGQPEA